MADTSNKNDRSKGPGTNPNVSSHSGGINPSAPTTGTEGWGSTSDERKNVSTHDPEGTRAGQMKGNPGDNMTSASQRASDAATTNKRPSKNSGDDQADLSRHTSASAHSMNTSHGGTDHTFRCADVGNSDCQWQTSGRTESEVMEKIVEHSRDHHGMTDWTEAMRSRVRDSIRRRAA
jgi:predicted small metal-binding protein